MSARADTAAIDVAAGSNWSTEAAPFTDKL
jgi:hypothetical protein